MLEMEAQQPGYTLRVRIDDVGRHSVWYNAEPVVTDRMVWGTKGEHRFQRTLDGRPVTLTALVTMAGLTTCRFRVLENDRSVHDTTHRIKLPGLRDTFKGFLPKQPAGMPRWAWCFVGPCVAMPVLTLGGAVPALLGFGGAAICAAVASRTRWPTAARVTVCALVTLACWIGLAVVLVALQPALGRR